MKICSTLKVIGILVLFAANVAANQLMLKNWKDSQGNFKKEMLAELKELFARDVFIETGTYGGATTAVAAQSFKSVYSIELHEPLYRQAITQFQHVPQIKLFLGDSAEVLRTILPSIQERVIFWLDAHTCGIGTGFGSTKTPILQELEAIRDWGRRDTIIIMDDVRGCKSIFSTDNDPKEWPTLKEVVKKIYEINPDYMFVVLCDVAIAFPKQENIDVSALIKALTTSLLVQEKVILPIDEIETLLMAESAIGAAQGIEADALELLAKRFGHDDGIYRIWYGCMLKHQGRYKEACEMFKASRRSMPKPALHWRVDWYIADMAYKSGDIELAKRSAQNVIKACPNFMPAKNLLVHEHAD